MGARIRYFRHSPRSFLIVRFFFLLLWRSEHWRRLIDADIAAAAPPSAARQTVRPGAPSSCHPLRFFHRRFSSPSSVSPLCLLSFSFRISFLFFGSFFSFLGPPAGRCSSPCSVPRGPGRHNDSASIREPSRFTRL